jgi:hypothetical protein
MEDPSTMCAWLWGPSNMSPSLCQCMSGLRGVAVNIVDLLLFHGSGQEDENTFKFFH